MPDLVSRTICEAPGVRVRDVRCTACRGRHHGAEECDSSPTIVLPYRGTFIRRLGSKCGVADLNQVLFFNAGEGYRVDHPADGGDACLSFEFAPQWLEAMRDDSVTLPNGVARFGEPQRAVTPRAQLLLWRLRRSESADVSLLEQLAVMLLREIFGSRRRIWRVCAARRRLVERAKLLLQAHPAVRWSLSGLASELRTSPVYLTQTFSQIEGIPLYRYQTQLRLARVLAAIDQCDDLAALAQDHGFSSHSQFTSAFARTYGLTPSAYRSQTRRGRRVDRLRIG